MKSARLATSSLDNSRSSPCEGIEQSILLRNGLFEGVAVRMLEVGLRPGRFQENSSVVPLASNISLRWLAHCIAMCCSPIDETAVESDTAPNSDRPNRVSPR
jgi:hypothetical protein